MVKNEVNVPVLKNFVEMLYSATLDISNKNKHKLVIIVNFSCRDCIDDIVTQNQNMSIN